MEQRPIFAYIPPNIGDSGGMLGGLLNTRRVIEAIISLIPSALLYGILKIFLPLNITLFITAVIALPLAGLCIVGIGGEPFSVFIANCINYENRRNFVTLRPPIPDYLFETNNEQK